MTITLTAADLRDPMDSEETCCTVEGPVEREADGSCYCSCASANDWEEDAATPVAVAPAPEGVGTEAGSGAEVLRDSASLDNGRRATSNLTGAAASRPGDGNAVSRDETLRKRKLEQLLAV